MLCAAVLAGGCGAGGTSSAGSAADPESDTATEWFVDRAAASGLDFVHVNGMSGGLSLAEIMGSGVGLFDYDNDDDLDVFVVQGGAISGQSAAGTAGDRLYRNDLRAGDPASLTFTDVTASSGIAVRSYGMGVATGDVDNDGWVDLYLTRLGPDVLLRNNGNGTFTDITRAAGIAEAAWSIPASFLDFDRDGWLDLYVGGYVHYDIARATPCRGPTGAVDYCTPQAYPPAAGHLFRNSGNGRFVDVTAASGIAAEYGPALGSIAADLSGDGWVDLYVANDGTPNQLWLNQQDGTFRNGALLAGVALSAAGRPEGSMGVDAGDFDADGDEDLIVTNLFGEGTALYVNDGAGLFEDRGAVSALRPSSLRHTGFGVAWADLDNDGWLDALTANGAVQMAQPFARPGDAFPLDQPLQLFRNRGDGRFEDATATGGSALAAPAVGRGAAYGDIDNDGDTDVVVSSNNGPLKLLINQTGNRHHWVGIGLTTADGRRMPLGARVGIVGRDGRTRWRRIRSDGSYASASDARALIGLGDTAAPVEAIVIWPDGTRTQQTLAAVDRWVTIGGAGR